MSTLHIKILSLEKFLNFSFVLFLSLPVVLITGPAIPDIIVSLVAIYFLLITIINKKYDYYKSYFILFFSIFIIYGLVRSLFTEYIWFSLSEEGAIFYFRYLFFALGISYLIDKYSILFKKFSIILISCVTILFFDSFYQLINGVNFFGIEPASNFRITSFMGDEAILGRYVAFISSIAIFLLFTFDFFKYQKIILFLLIPISLSIIIISGDRAPLFRYFILILLLPLFIKNKYRKTFLTSLLSALIFASIIVLSINKVKTRVIEQTINQLNFDNFRANLFDNDYLQIYKVSYEIGLTNPIFGQGPNMHEILCKSPKYHNISYNCTHPHSFYFQLFAEQGIVGIFFLISFYVYLIFNLSKTMINKNKNKYSETNEFYPKIIGIELLLIAFLFPLLPNMSFYNNWNNIFLFLIIGIWLNFKKNYKLNSN